MNLRKILIWSGVGLLVTGIAMWLKVQIELSKSLVYGTANSKLKKLTPSELAVEFNMTIDNPTTLNFGINGMNIDVYANGVKVTNILSAVPKLVSANSMTYIPLKMTLNPQSLIQNTGVLLSTGLSLDNVVLTMKGSLKIRKFGFVFPVPFIYTSTYKQLMG